MKPAQLLLPLGFTISLASFVLMPAFAPSLRLCFFAPFLVLAYYRASYFKALALSVLCGFLIDLYSSDTRMGLYTLTYFLTTVCLYGRKQTLFEDQPSTLPLMTLLFSVVSQGFDLLARAVVQTAAAPTAASLVTDFLLMPFADAVYGWILFSLFLKWTCQRAVRARVG